MSTMYTCNLYCIYFYILEVRRAQPPVLAFLYLKYTSFLCFVVSPNVRECFWSPNVPYYRTWHNDIVFYLLRSENGPNVSKILQCTIIKTDTNVDLTAIKGAVRRAAFITNSLFFKGQIWQDLYD